MKSNVSGSTLCGIFFAVALGVMAGAAGAQQDGPRIVRAPPPAPPIYSKDGAVKVLAPASKAGYRAPVLIFVDRTREELQRVVRLKLGSTACPLEVAIGGKGDGDKRVLTARLRDHAGGLRERIELPDPEAAELGLFRRAVCVALLRAWMVDAGGTDESMRDLPVWLIDGVVRNLDREARLADADRAHLLWSKACLPAAGELFAFDSFAAAREPAVAAVLAGWFLEKRQAGNAFEALLSGAAHGAGWTSERVAHLLVGAQDLAAFDEALDLWFLSERRRVLTPGVTTEGVVRRFRACLLLYPADYGKTVQQDKAWLTFQEATALADDAALRRGALSKAASVKLAALGRDGMLLAVAEAYARFLEAFARGEKPGLLSRLLMEAETRRAELERKTASGAVLRRSVDG